MNMSMQRLASLLRRRSDDPSVLSLLGAGTTVERVEHLGYAQLTKLGVSVMFAEAPYVLPPAEIHDERSLYLNCFHLHSEGHEGYSKYPESLPSGIAFGDSGDEIVAKLGYPTETGGGGLSEISRTPIPRWLRYASGESIMQFQLDEAGNLQMVSLYVPDPRH